MKLLVIASMFASTVAHAGDAPPAPAASFELIERGDAVEVVAHNVKAAKTAINPMRSRLEVEVTGRPRAQTLFAPVGHKPVVLVEFDPDSGHGVLSVKLGFGYGEVKTLARFAQALQVGDDLHVLFPRTVPADGASVVLPEPTLPPELVAKLAEKKEPPKKAEEPKPAPAVAKTAPMPSAPAEVPAVTTKVEDKKEKLQLPAESDDGWSKMSMFAALGLGGIGAGVWLLKRKKGVLPVSSIDVIAQRSIGPKAKIVWVGVGGREMVVAVTAQSVRMLGQWPRTQREPAAERAELPPAQAIEPRDTKSYAEHQKSAVAGLMKLRARTSSVTLQAQEAPSLVARTASRTFREPPPMTDDDADDAADAAWARDIIAATGARR